MRATHGAREHHQLGWLFGPAVVALREAAFAAARQDGGGGLSVAEALELVTSLRVVAAG